MGVVLQNTAGGAIKIVQGTSTQIIATGVAQTSAGAFSPPSGTGFIHITANVMDGAARNPLASEVPGFDGVTVTGVPANTWLVQATGAAAAVWVNPSTVTVGTATTVTPGVAGQFYVTNAGPAAVWTSLALMELTHGRTSFGNGGADAVAIIGPAATFETTYGAVYLLPHGTAAAANNFAVLGNGSDVYLNTPAAGGNVYFYAANATLLGAFSASQSRFYAAGNTGAAPFLVDWATPNQTQIISGTAATSLLIASTGATSSIILQPGSNGITWRDSGAVQRGSIEIVHGIAKFGGGGSDWYGAIGPDDTSSTVESCVWLLPPATARSGTNMSLLNNGGATYLNTQGTYLSFSANSFGTNLAWMQASTSSFYIWGMPNFTWDPGGGAPVLQHSARVSDLLPAAFTIRAQYAFATATGANRTPGSIVLDYGPPTNASNGEAYVKVTRNNIFMWAAGANASAPLSQAMMWLGPGITPASANCVMVTDGTSFTYMNTPNGGALGWVLNDASFVLYGTVNDVYFGGTSTAAPMFVDWAAPAAPKIQGGTATTSLTVGTNKAAATTVLQGDAATTILTLSTFGEFATKVRYDQIAAPAAPPAGACDLYVDNADTRMKAIDPTGHVYVIPG